MSIQIGPYKVGGITGNLYDVFDVVGAVFFTLLIGWQRAKRSSLAGERVFFGGWIIATLLSATVVVLFVDLHAMFPELAEAKAFYTFVAGAGVALGGGLLLGGSAAGIVNSYVSRVEQEVRREKARREQAARLEKERELRFKEKYDDLIDQGVDAETAKARAELHVRGRSESCVIATAIFGSPNAPQVIAFRHWRDTALLTTSHGRCLVRAYYWCSPYVVSIVRNNEWFRAIGRRVLTSVLLRLARSCRIKGRSACNHATAPDGLRRR